MTIRAECTAGGGGASAGDGDDLLRAEPPGTASDSSSSSTAAANYRASVDHFSEDENGNEQDPLLANNNFEHRGGNNKGPNSTEQLQLQQQEMEEACRKLVEKNLRKWHDERPVQFAQEFSSLLSAMDQELGLAMAEARQEASREEATIKQAKTGSRDLLVSLKSSLDKLDIVEELEGKKSTKKDHKERLPQTPFPF